MPSVSSLSARHTRSPKAWSTAASSMGAVAIVARPLLYRKTTARNALSDPTETITVSLRGDSREAATESPQTLAILTVLTGSTTVLNWRWASMRRTKGHPEFDRWWKDWIAKRTQTHVLVEPRSSGMNLCANLERTTDADPCNLAPYEGPLGESGTTQVDVRSTQK
jgi:hypothetical protein